MSDNPFADDTHDTYSPPLSRSSGIKPQDLQRKEEELRRREMELDRREQELAQREQIVGERSKFTRPPNWPRWPKPLVHQDIDGEITNPELKPIVKKAYYGWYVVVACLIWNLVTMIGTLASDGAVGDFVLAIVILMIWGPITFLYYRLLYNACRKKSSLRYTMYLFFLGFQILVHIFWAVGVVGSGMGGFLWMLKLFNAEERNTVVAIFSLIDFVLWVGNVIFFGYLWVAARMRYKLMGGSDQAQREFAQEAGRQAANNPDLVMAAGKRAASSV